MPDESFKSEAAKPNTDAKVLQLSFDAALCAKAEHDGLDIAQVAAEALKRAVNQKAEIVKAEIRADMDAYNAYIGKHGSPAEHMRWYLTEKENSTDAI